MKKPARIVAAFLILLSTVVSVGLFLRRSSGTSPVSESKTPEALGPIAHPGGPMPSLSARKGSAARGPVVPTESFVLTPEAGSVEIRNQPRLQEIPEGFAYHAPTWDATFQPGFIRFAPVVPAARHTPVLECRLEEIRSGDRLLVAGEAAPPRQGARPGEVEYDRGPVVERYTVRAQGLEQEFIIDSLPEPGDLRVRCLVSSPLTPPAESTRARTLSFREDDRESLTFSEAVAVDAEGRRLPLDLTYADGRISLLVPKDWVQAATFPITIDPLVNSSFLIDDTNAGNPDVAYNTVRNEWLVVWEEVSVTPARVVRGQRVSSAGVPVGGQITIGSASLKNFSARISYAANVDRYLVVWQFLDANYKDSPPSQIHGRVLNGDGTAFTPEFSVATETASQLPVVAYDGARWFVCWSKIVFGSLPYPASIHGVFVTTAGALGNTADPDPTTVDKRYPRLAFGAGRYVISWPQVVSGTTWEIRARAMDSAGTFSGNSVIVDGAPSQWGGAGSDVSFSGGKFLHTWPSSAGELRGRISDQNLAFAGQNFVINDGVLGTGATHSPGTADRWFTLFEAPNSVPDILSNEVNLSGGVSPIASITTNGNSCKSPRGAWSGPSANDLLVVYRAGASPFQILGQRYHLLAVLPPAPPPPTGPIALPGNSSIMLSWTTAPGATGYVVGRSLTSGGPYDSIATVSGTSIVDTDVFDGVTYYYVVSAFNSGGSSANSSQVNAIPNPGPLPVLLVVGNATTLNNGDTEVRNRLQALGYSVSVIQHDSPSLPTSASGKRLVLISSTVTSGLVLATFRDVVVPVVVWESAVMDDMRMTGTAAGQFGATPTGQTTITVNAGHALAAGLSGPVSVSTSQPVTWGIPGPAAVVAALVSGSTTQAAIYGYDTGASMPVPVGTPAFFAPARRVGFFMGDSTAAFLTNNGALLFEAAVAWAVGGPAAPLNLYIRESDATAYLSWTPSAGALSYTVQRALSAGGPYVTIKSGLTGCDYLDTGLTNGTPLFYRILAVSAQGVSVGSVEAQATPAAVGILEIGITGTPYIKQMRQNQPASFWHQGDYTAYVYTRTNTPGVYAAVPNVTSSWSLIQAPPGVFISNATQFTCTVLASQNVANIDQIDAIRLQYTASAPGYQLKTFRVVIEMRARTNVTMVFRFPQNVSGTGQTQRQWPAGQAAKFFDEDQNTRDQARTDWGNDFLNQTQQVLKQSGVILYPILDRDLLKVGGFSGSGTFETTKPGSNVRSDGLQTLIGKNFGSGGNVINVYLVRQLHSAYRGANLNGNTSMNETDWGATIMLSDPSSTPGDGGAPSTLAHETLHALGRGHLASYPEMYGLLNNLKAVIGDSSTPTGSLNYPLNWNIMREYSAGRRTDANGDWVLPWQYDKSRTCARSFHPAFRQLD